MLHDTAVATSDLVDRIRSNVERILERLEGVESVTLAAPAGFESERPGTIEVTQVTMSRLTTLADRVERVATLLGADVPSTTAVTVDTEALRSVTSGITPRVS